MDLSIIDRALRLRDEARKAQLGDNAPDVTPLSRGENGRMEQPTSLPDDKIAVDLMGSALALFDEMNKVIDPSSGPAPDPQSSVDVAELLEAATAPLPTFDDSELAGVEQPPVVEEPPVAQPPLVGVPPIVRPPVAQPPISPPPIINAIGGIVREPRITAVERPPAKRAAPKKKGGARKKKPKRGES